MCKEVAGESWGKPGQEQREDPAMLSLNLLSLGSARAAGRWRRYRLHQGKTLPWWNSQPFGGSQCSLSELMQMQFII